MTRRSGLAPAVLVALVSFEAGCAGAPAITSSPDSTAAGTLPASAVPTDTASAPVNTATPQATDLQPAWRVASKLDSPGIGTLVGFDAGYVMSGFRREVFFAPNGEGWQRVEVPWTTRTNNGVEMDARIMSIGGSGRHAVAVGYAYQEPCQAAEPGDGGPPPCRLLPVSWVTENGIDWVAGEAGDVRIETFAYPRFMSIWPVGGGWDGAIGEEGVISEQSALAHSDDGMHWTALAPVPGSATGDAPAGYVGGVGTPDGQRIIWTFDEADNLVRLWRSEGGGWTVIGDLGPDIGITASLGPSEPGQPWLIGAGERADGGPRLWVSADGIHFEEATLPGGSGATTRIESLVRWQGGYLALAAYGLEPAAIWSSADGWEWTPEPAMTAGWPYLEQLVVGPSGLAAVHGAGPDGEDLYARTILLRE